MKRMVSGVQATGQLHLGHYLGILKPWARLQHEHEAFFFIPNLHSLNTRPDAEVLREQTLANVAWLLASGVDPNRATIYAQSQIPAHSELCWILNNFVTMGELNRMTQYKDKAVQGGTGEIAALFTYPVLMAADILLYDAQLVPVGEDQRQHVELTRDIATRFNNLYGPVFQVPEVILPGVGGRVMNLQHAERKMSKSDSDQAGNLLLLDSPDVLTNKIKRAVTDSGSTLELADSKPALANLIEIYAGLSEESPESVVGKFTGQGYGAFKQELADLVVTNLQPLQQRFAELMDDRAYLEQVLEAGRGKATPIAAAKLAEVKSLLGVV